MIRALYDRLYSGADRANRRISDVVNHPFSGWFALVVIIGWFAASRIWHIDPDLTFLGAGSNSLQTYLLFIIAAATAGVAVGVRSAHAHAQSAHDRINEAVGATPDPDADLPRPKSARETYKAWDLPAGRRACDFIAPLCPQFGHYVSLNVEPDGGARTAYYTELFTNRLGAPHSYVVAADGLPWYFVVTLPWRDIVEGEIDAIVADHIRTAIRELDCEVPLRTVLDVAAKNMALRSHHGEGPDVLAPFKKVPL